MTEFSIEFNKQFKLKEIEYFDSKLSIENENIILDDKFWIQNVFVFIQWIKNIISIWKKKTVKSNIFLCLWEAAVMWYTNLLNNIEKTELQFNLNFWFEMLKKWFCENSAIALRKLNKLKYTHQDVQNQVSADSYITKALHHAETCSQINFNALLTAWQKIDVKMQIHVLQFMSVIIKYDFVKTMKNQQFNWKSMFLSFLFSCKTEFRQELFKSLFNQYFYYQSVHISYM